MAHEDIDPAQPRPGDAPSGDPPGDRTPAAAAPGRPVGEVYDWYRRGMALLEGGDAGAAAELLTHARSQAPGSASVREALARALFGSGRHAEAADVFRELVSLHPGDDYALFGLGLSLSRLDRYEEAVEQLALAAAMRPDRQEYIRALREARATLRARAEATGE